MRRALPLLALPALALVSSTRAAVAQSVPGTQGEPNSGYRLIPPRVPPTLSPAVLVLLEQEGKFQQAVQDSGGKGFSSFFAEDGVVLSNGKPVVQGRAAIAAQAQWDPKQYQLTWSPEGAQMGPSGDMGFTWGSYQGVSQSAALAGTPASQKQTASGRYMTVWKKENGAWKVALEASADAPPAEPDCCTVPHP